MENKLKLLREKNLEIFDFLTEELKNCTKMNEDLNEKLEICQVQNGELEERIKEKDLRINLKQEIINSKRKEIEQKRVEITDIKTSISLLRNNLEIKGEKLTIDVSAIVEKKNFESIKPLYDYIKDDIVELISTKDSQIEKKENEITDIKASISLLRNNLKIKGEKLTIDVSAIVEKKNFESIKPLYDYIKDDIVELINTKNSQIEKKETELNSIKNDVLNLTDCFDQIGDKFTINESKLALIRNTIFNDFKNKLSIKDQDINDNRGNGEKYNASAETNISECANDSDSNQIENSEKTTNCFGDTKLTLNPPNHPSDD